MVLVTHCNIFISVLLSSTGVNAYRVQQFDFIFFKFILNDTYVKIFWRQPSQCNPDYYEVVMVGFSNNRISRSKIGNSTSITISREVLSPTRLVSYEIYIQAYSNISLCAVSATSLLIHRESEFDWKTHAIFEHIEKLNIILTLLVIVYIYIYNIHTVYIYIYIYIYIYSHIWLMQW